MPLALAGPDQQAGIQPPGGAPGRPAGADPHRQISGKTYRTPLDAQPLHDGQPFIPMYGPGTDWVKNVLLAQAVRLSIDGHEIELQSPAVGEEEGHLAHAAHNHKTLPGISSESELLRMDITDKAANSE